MKQRAPLLTLIALVCCLAAFLIPTQGQIPQSLTVSPGILLKNSGTPLGQITTLNCSTNTTCTNTGPVGTITATGGGGSLTLQTNGTNNGSQTLLNLANGSGITITDGGSGTVTIASSGAGSYVLVEEHTANNSATALNFTTCFSSTYDDYEIRVLNLLNASATQRVLLQMHASGNYDTGSNYQWVSNFQLAGTGGASSDGSAADTGIQIGPGQMDTSATWGGVSGDFRIQNPLGGGTQYVALTGQSVQKDSRDAVLNGRNEGAFYKSSAAVDGFRLITSSGNLASGTVRCYGLTH